jgi:putative NIF3 family GTP cyclohydrolase 1 type 2
MKRMTIGNLAAVLLVAGTAFAQPAQKPTAQQIIKRIQDHLGTPWTTPTVDTFKAGDPDAPVSGIAVTMMATLDVLQRAAASGATLVITHEPTFYNHQDSTAALQAQSDGVLAEKEAFIRDHHLVVWRFHDNWHRRKPDGILSGMVHALGWEAYQNSDHPQLFTLPETTVADLAEQLKRKLDIKALRAVGDPSLKVTKVAMMPGAAGSEGQMKLLERGDVQVLVIGETREWETVEYVADAATEHKQKALLILGHIPSEQAGMEECARWLKTFVSDVSVQFIPAREPFWTPR